MRDAEALAQAGQKEEAIALYRRAYKYDPDDLHVRRGLDALEQGELPPAFEAAIVVEEE